jgi:hypothetical protein
MSERDPHRDVVDALTRASRAERPHGGAKARALEAVLPELGVATSVPAHVTPRTLSVRFLRMSATLSAAALFVALVGGGLFLKHQEDVASAEQAAAAAELAAQRAQTDKLMEQLRQQAESVASLQGAVQNAKDDSQRAAALAQLEEAKRAQNATVSRLQSRPAAGGGAGRGAAKPSPACNCTPGDPLCSCVP